MNWQSNCGCTNISVFIKLNPLAHSSVQTNFLSFLSNSNSGAACWENYGRNLRKNESIPKNDFTSKYETGCLKSNIFCILLCSGIVTSPDKIFPKNFTFEQIDIYLNLLGNHTHNLLANFSRMTYMTSNISRKCIIAIVNTTKTYNND